MRKLLILLFLCFASICFAGSNNVQTVFVEVAGGGISDNFSSDTSANYTVIFAGGGITIGSGSATASTNFQVNTLYHETELSSNHWVQLTAEDEVTGLVIGYDSAGDDGYAIYISSNFTQVRLITDGTVTGTDACTDIDVTAESPPFLIKASWNGSDDMDVWVNGTQYVTNCNPSTDYAGTFVGVYWNRQGTTYTIDDLTADDN